MIFLDDETLEQDVEMNPESSCRGTNGVVTCNIQMTNTCNNSFDHEDDGKLQGYTNECKLNYAEAKKEPSQKTTKPEIKTMKIPFTGISDLKKICLIYNIYQKSRFFYLNLEKFPNLENKDRKLSDTCMFPTCDDSK